MRNILLFFIALVLASISYAAPVKRMHQDMKLPTQKIIEQQDITDPDVADVTGVLNASVGPSSTAVTVISTGYTNPSVPRNVLVTPQGTTADVASCVVTLTGTNFYDSAITEAFTFSANASTAQTGSKAFKTVSSASFAASCEDSPYTATWSIGQGEKIGLKRCMDSAGHVVFSTIDGAYEATRATVAAHSTQIENNTADFNGTMDGSSDFEAFFIQNYGCFP